MIDNVIWYFKYSPKTLEEYVGNDTFKQMFEQWKKQKQIPHILLYGHPGTGKTTFSKLIAKKLNAQYYYVNASDEANIALIRTNIKQFVETGSMNSDTQKIVILDEVEGASEKFQKALRPIMDNYEHLARFILTSNYINMIENAVTDRCMKFQLDNVPREKMKEKAVICLKTEGIQFDMNIVEKIVNRNHPSFRGMYEELQLCSTSGKLIDKEHQHRKALAHILNAIDKKDLIKVREIILNMSMDFPMLYNMMFVYYLNKQKMNNALIVGEFLYRDSKIANQEINFLTCCGNIIKGK